MRDSLPTFRKITGPFLRNEAEGADTIVWMVASDEAADASGLFFHDREPRPTHRMKKTREADAKRERFLEQVASDAAPYLEDEVTPLHEKRSGDSADAGTDDSNVPSDTTDESDT